MLLLIILSVWVIAHIAQLLQNVTAPECPKFL